MTFVLVLGSTAHAAVYLWNGSAGDGNWDTAANWTVTDSIWTWPNEENAADPNLAKNINSDTGGIDILNGDAVSRGSDLGIDGAADGSTTGVLTLNNASSLTVSGSLATGTDPVKRGQIDILGGSFVTIVGDGNDLIIADEPDSWGALNIVDSTVDIAGDLKAGDGGEGHVTIGGSTTVNCDDLYIADAATGVGYLDISGTATVTIVDDFTIDEGTGIATIGGDAVINFGDDLYVADKGGSVGTLILTGNSIFNVGDDMNIGDDDGSEGHMIVTGNATLNAPDELYISDSAGAVGSLDVSGTAMVTISDDLNVGDDGPGSCNIGENATVNVADKIYVAGELGSEGSLNISGNATVETGGDFVVADVAGNTGYLHISGNPTIHTVGNFYMNDDEGAPSTSEVIMDGGTVTVDGTSTFNDDNPGTATFIMNGGSWYSKDYLNVSDNLDGTAHLTMNGGEMITGDALILGKDDGEDIGQVRIFMNGGLLKAEKLDIAITDTQIIYTGGAFMIGSADVNEADMQQLITDGTIVADGVYSIVTAGDYTLLNPWAPPMPKLPYPADGAEGVLLGTTLSWVAGTTAATHDVYFGTSSPPPFICNQEATTYYQPLEVGTTYYWQIVEVEADGTTKHAGDVWSFTTTTDLSTVSEIATQPNPADGALGVAVDATLSWWPGASAVSQDVYFGTTSPPALLGSTTELSFVPGPLAVDTIYYWRVDAVEADGTIHTGDIWSFTTLTPPPAGWACQDIGTTGGVTLYESTTGTWTIIADGIDIWDNADGFRFCYQQPTLTRGDCTLIANVVDFPVPPGGDLWQKAGLMIRETLDPGSKNAFVAISGGSGDGATFQWRTDTDGSSDSSRTLVVPPPPASVKLVRQGDTFTGYVLLDGQWQQEGNSATVVMGDEVYVGLAVTSHKGGVLATAVIDGVSITTPSPKIAWGPDPADGATEVPTTATLSWGPGATAASHDVYFGDSEPPAFIGNQTETSYSPTLDKGKTYYWRIDEVEADGTTKHTGAVWSFTVTTAGR